MKRPDIVSIVGKTDKTLELGYSNGEKRIFDVKPYIEGRIFSSFMEDFRPQPEILFLLAPL